MMRIILRQNLLTRESLVIEVNMHECDTGYSPGRKCGIYFNYNLFADPVSSSAIQCHSRIIRELIRLLEKTVAN